MWYQSESARPMPPVMPLSVGIAHPAKIAATTTATIGRPRRWAGRRGGRIALVLGTGGAGRGDEQRDCRHDHRADQVAGLREQARRCRGAPRARSRVPSWPPRPRPGQGSPEKPGSARRRSRTAQKASATTISPSSAAPRRYSPALSARSRSFAHLFLAARSARVAREVLRRGSGCGAGAARGSALLADHDRALVRVHHAQAARPELGGVRVLERLRAL